MRITSHEIILSTHLIRRSEHLCNQTQMAKQRKIAKINPAFRLERKRLNKTWVISIKTSPLRKQMKRKTQYSNKGYEFR